MFKNKFFMALAAIMLSLLFVLPQLMSVNVKADETETTPEESLTDETENKEDSAPLFSARGSVLYAAPGVTVDDILNNLEGAVEVITGIDSDTSEEEEEPDTDAVTEPEEEASEEEPSEEPAEEPSEESSEEPSEEPSEEDEEATLAGTGMTVLMDDGAALTVVVMGDLDGNGAVTVMDARCALRMAVNLDTPTFAQEIAGVVNVFLASDDAEAEEAEDETEAEEDTTVIDEAEADEETAEAEEETTEPEEDKTEETETVISVSDARAILRAAVELENAEDWYKAVTAADEEADSDEDTTAEEEPGEEESSSEEAPEEE